MLSVTMRVGGGGGAAGGAGGGVGGGGELLEQPVTAATNPMSTSAPTRLYCAKAWLFIESSIFMRYRNAANGHCRSLHSCPACDCAALPDEEPHMEHRPRNYPASMLLP